MGDHKLTSTVYHNHVWFALDGHNLGMGMMHVCAPPAMPGPCTMMPINILMSSRKAKFKAGEVKANGKPVACCTMIEPSSPGAITPMMVCGAIPVPTAGCGMSVALNSLVVGMDWTDLLAGWADIVVSMVQAAITSAMSGGTLEAGEFEAVGFEPIPDFGGLAGAGVRQLGQAYGGHRGDVEYEYKPIGGPFVEAGVTRTIDGETGDVTAEEFGQVGAGGIVRGRGSRSEVLHRDGSRESEYGGSVQGAGGAERRVRRRDGEWESESTGSSLPWSDDVDVPFL
jgi:hypothetical protein